MLHTGIVVNRVLIPMSDLTRQQLRQHLRKARRSIPESQRRLAARQIAHRLARFKPLRHARHVAVYSAIASELSLAAFTQTQTSRQLYLPKIIGDNMRFVASRGGMRRNRFSISEPRRHKHRPVWAMSVILMPLLGFDSQGNRLGQGGGYYDRALAKLRFRRPWLVGIGYDQQHCEQIPSEAWDVPLDALLTPTQTLYFRKPPWPVG